MNDVDSVDIGLYDPRVCYNHCTASKCCVCRRGREGEREGGRKGEREGDSQRAPERGTNVPDTNLSMSLNSRFTESATCLQPNKTAGFEHAR